MKSPLSLLKTAIHKFQEIFWPALSKNQVHEEPQILEIKDLNISDDNLEKAFDLKTKIHEKEVERRNTVESRATLFISTIRRL